MDMANSGPPPVLGAHMMGNLSVPLGSTNLAVASGMTIMTMGLVLENLVKQSDMNSQAHPQPQLPNQNQNYSNFSRRMSKSRNPHRSRKKDSPSATKSTEFLPTMFPDSSRLPEYLTSPRNYDTVLNYPGYFYSKVGDKSYKNNVSFYNYGLARPDTPQDSNEEKEELEPYTFTKRPITNVDEDTHVLAGFENEPLYKNTKVLAPPKTSVSFMDLSESPFHATNEAIKAKFQPQFGQGSFVDLPEKVKATQEPDEAQEFSTFGQKETVPVERSFSTERGRVKVVRKKVPKVPHKGGFRTVVTHEIGVKDMNRVPDEGDQEPFKGKTYDKHKPNEEFVRHTTRRYQVGPTSAIPSVSESLDIQAPPNSSSNPTFTTTAKSVDVIKPTSYSYKDGQSYVQVNLSPEGETQDPSQASIPNTNDPRNFNVINLGEDEDLFNEDLTFQDDHKSKDPDALYPNTFFHNIPKPTHSHEDLGDTSGFVHVTNERPSYGPMAEQEPVRPSKFPNFPIRAVYPGKPAKINTISPPTTPRPYLQTTTPQVQPSEVTCVHEPFAVHDHVKPTNRPTTTMGPLMDALVPEYLDVIQTRKDTIPQLGHGLEDVDKAFFDGLNELKDLHGRQKEDTRIELGNTDTFIKIQENFNRGNVLKSEPDLAMVYLDEHGESLDEIPEGPLYYGEIVERPPDFDVSSFHEDKPDSESDRDFLKIVDQFENKLVTESNHFKDQGYRRKKHPLPQVIQEHVHEFQDNFDTLDSNEQFHDTDGHTFHPNPTYPGSGPGPSSPQDIIQNDSQPKRPSPNQFKFGDFNSDLEEFVTDDREILELTEFPISEEMIFDEPAHLTFESSGPPNYDHSGPVSDGYDIPEPSYTLDVDLDWQRKHILSKINSRNRLNIPRSLKPPRHKAQYSILPQELVADNDPGFRRRQEMLLKLQRNNKFQRLLKQYGFDQFSHKPLSRKKKLMLIKRIQQIKRNQLRMAQNGPHLRDRNFKAVHPLNGPAAHHGQRGRPFPRRPQGPIVPLVQTGHRLHKFKTPLKVVTPADRKFDVVYPHGVEDDSIISQIARFGNFDNFVIGFLINYVYNRYVRNQFLRDVPAILANQVPTILNTLGFGGKKRSLNNGPLLDPAVYSIASNNSEALVEALAMPDDLWRGFSEWDYFNVYDIDSLFTLLDEIEEKPSHLDNLEPRVSIDAPFDSVKSSDQTESDEPLAPINSTRTRRETQNSRVEFSDAKEYLQKVVYPSMSKNDPQIIPEPPTQSNLQYKEEYMKENADMLQNVLKNQSIQNVIHQIDTKTSDFIKKLISPDTELIKVNDTLQILRIKDIPAKNNNGLSSTQLTTTLNSIRSTQTEAPVTHMPNQINQFSSTAVRPMYPNYWSSESRPILIDRTTTIASAPTRHSTTKSAHAPVIKKNSASKTSTITTTTTPTTTTTITTTITTTTITITTSITATTTTTTTTTTSTLTTTTTTIKTRTTTVPYNALNAGTQMIQSSLSGLVNGISDMFLFSTRANLTDANETESSNISSTVTTAAPAPTQASSTAAINGTSFLQKVPLIGPMVEFMSVNDPSEPLINSESDGNNLAASLFSTLTLGGLLMGADYAALQGILPIFPILARSFSTDRIDDRRGLMRRNRKKPYRNRNRRRRRRRRRKKNRVREPSSNWRNRHPQNKAFQNFGVQDVIHNPEQAPRPSLFDYQDHFAEFNQAKPNDADLSTTSEYEADYSSIWDHAEPPRVPKPIGANEDYADEFGIPDEVITERTKAFDNVYEFVNGNFDWGITKQAADSFQGIFDSTTHYDDSSSTAPSNMYDYDYQPQNRRMDLDPEEISFDQDEITFKGPDTIQEKFEEGLLRTSQEAEGPLDQDALDFQRTLDVTQHQNETQQNNDWFYNMRHVEEPVSNESQDYSEPTSMPAWESTLLRKSTKTNDRLDYDQYEYDTSGNLDLTKEVETLSQDQGQVQTDLPQRLRILKMQRQRIQRLKALKVLRRQQQQQQQHHNNYDNHPYQNPPNTNLLPQSGPGVFSNGDNRTTYNIQPVFPGPSFRKRPPQVVKLLPIVRAGPQRSKLPANLDKFLTERSQDEAFLESVHSNFDFGAIITAAGLWWIWNSYIEQNLDNNFLLDIANRLGYQDFINGRHFEAHRRDFFAKVQTALSSGQRKYGARHD